MAQLQVDAGGGSDSAGAATPDIGVAKRIARSDLARPAQMAMYALGPIAALAFWLLGRWNLVEPESIWTIFGLIAGGVALASIASLYWMRRRSSRWRLNLRIAVHVAAVTVIIYTTGWGPMLVITYMIVAHETINRAGASSWRALIFWCSLAMLAGQGAIALSIAPSFVSTSRSWGMAALAEIGLVAVIRQFSLLAAEKERAEESVALSEHRFRLLVNNASDIILVLNDYGRVTYSSPAIGRVLGVEPVAVEGMTLEHLSHPEDLPGLLDVFDQSKASPGALLSLETRLLSRLHPTVVRNAIQSNDDWEIVEEEKTHRDENWCWVEASFVNLLQENSVKGIVATIHDVTERRHQALYDALTGLPNRVLLQELGSEAVASAVSQGGKCGLLLMDLNKFKDVNDTYGHHYGDELLCVVSARLERAIREQDTVVRLGGDEFAVVLPAVEDLEVAIQVSKRITDALEEPFRILDVSVTVGVSIGIALYPEHGNTLGELMMKSDAAMYNAKRLQKDYEVSQ